MLPNYESVFGLHDNPFSPQVFEGVDSSLLDIAGDPLAVDEEPALEKLFVADAGPFRCLIKRFEKFLRTGGYGSDGQGRVKSKAFRVIGPQGSGKSTLTNVLVKRLKECGHPTLEPIRESAADGQLESALGRVRDMAKRNGDGPCCVVFDDVRLLREELLHELHQELRQPRRRPVVMFEIFDHAQELGDVHRSLGSRVDVEDLRTSWLSAEHAVAFLTSRIERFRIPNPLLAGDLATFPFDAEEVARVVGDGRSEGALTLRTLSRLLSQGLDDAVLEHDENGPIADLSADALAARAIKLQDIYDRAVLEQTGARI